jgi:hypothetical protein
MRQKIMNLLKEERAMNLGRLLVAVSVGVLATMPAGAAAQVAPTTVPISSAVASPFSGCTEDLVDLQRSSGFVDYPNSEVEPYVAVNPTNPDNLIAVWQQDRWRDGSSRGNLAGVSFDGGENWTLINVTRSNACTGNPFWVRATDPWVTFAPDGTAYFMHLAVYTTIVPPPATIGFDGMLVSRSVDGGLTWEEPTTLVLDTSRTAFNDKNSITADPNDSNFVYAVWDLVTSPPSDNGNPTAGENAVGYKGETIFTRSTDGGETWEPPRSILEPGTLKQTIGNQIVVRPAHAGGELINFFDLIHDAANAHRSRGFNVAVQISTDHGSTWSDAIIAAKMLPRPTVDPDTGLPVRTADFIFDAAVDPTNGNLYAVWEDARFSGGAYNDAALITSTDGGLSWSSPIAVPRVLTGVVGLTRQSFIPQVHVSADGRLAVSYYDFRHNDGSGVSETNYYVNQCAVPDPSQPNLCAGDWIETRVTAQSFDIREAPVTVRGLFLGDYVGLTDVPEGFGTAFAVSSPGDPATIHYSTVAFSP